MRRLLRHILVTAFVVGTAVSFASARQGASTDQDQLVQLVDRWAAARNANDPAAMKPLFDETMDHIRLSNGEVIARSAEGTLQWFAASFRGEGKGSTVTIHNRSARVVAADAAVVDFGFTILNQTGKTSDTNVTFFCVKRGGLWRVAALRHAVVDKNAGQ